MKERLEQVLKEEALNAEKGGAVPTPVPRMEDADDNLDKQSVASVTSMRAKEEAKLAGLKAKRLTLKKKHELELKEAQLKQEMEEMDIDAEIAEGEARESVLNQYEGGFSKASSVAAEDVNCGQQRQASGKVVHMTPHSDNQKHETQLMKIKPLPLPRFDGDPREYPRFRSDFLKQMAPRCAEEALAYTLRTCLCKRAQEIVKVIDDDFEEMLKRLDEEYGDPSHTVDMIVSQITRFRIPKDDRNRLVEFIEIVEKGFHDLKHLKMEHEMSNAGFVGLVETQLPDHIKEKWAERVNRDCSDVDKANKFPAMMKFLLETKRMTKYLSADIKSSTHSSAAKFTIPSTRNLSHVRTMTGNVRNMNACFFCEGPMPLTSVRSWVRRLSRRKGLCNEQRTVLWLFERGTQIKGLQIKKDL